jgi:hypothetical protein
MLCIIVKTRRENHFGDYDNPHENAIISRF